MARTSRRTFLRQAGLGVAGTFVSAVPARAQATTRPAFRFRYVVASSVYGKTSLAEILPEVRKSGAEHIDIWPQPFANHREQIEQMGHDRFAALLQEHRVRLGVMSRYDLGPFRLQDEMRVLKKLGGTTILCGSAGAKGLEGGELKAAVKEFAAKLEPHAAVAEELGVTIGIENHGGSLIESPDSMQWLIESVRSKHIGICLAPYHLPQEPKSIAALIERLGPRLVHLYAWQHGKGCHGDAAPTDLILQMPGRGAMDFTPIVAAMKKTDYKGWIEIFMHSVPSSTPIRPTTPEVTAEINRARQYLESCLQRA